MTARTRHDKKFEIPQIEREPAQQLSTKFSEGKKLFLGVFAFGIIIIASAAFVVNRKSSRKKGRLIPGDQNGPTKENSEKSWPSRPLELREKELEILNRQREIEECRVAQDLLKMSVEHIEDCIRMRAFLAKDRIGAMTQSELKALNEKGPLNLDISFHVLSGDWDSPIDKNTKELSAIGHSKSNAVSAAVINGAGLIDRIYFKFADLFNPEYKRSTLVNTNRALVGAEYEEEHAEIANLFRINAEDMLKQINKPCDEIEKSITKMEIVHRKENLRSKPATLLRLIYMDTVRNVKASKENSIRQWANDLRDKRKEMRKKYFLSKLNMSIEQAEAISFPLLTDNEHIKAIHLFKKKYMYLKQYTDMIGEKGAASCSNALRMFKEDKEIAYFTGIDRLETKQIVEKMLSILLPHPNQTTGAEEDSILAFPVGTSIQFADVMKMLSLQLSDPEVMNHLKALHKEKDLGWAAYFSKDQDSDNYTLKQQNIEANFLNHKHIKITGDVSESLFSSEAAQIVEHIFCSYVFGKVAELEEETFRRDVESAVFRQAYLARPKLEGF